MVVRKIYLICLLLFVQTFANWNGDTIQPGRIDISGKNYYRISSAEELAWFAKRVTSGDTAINGILVQDLVFGEENSVSSKIWEPIGNKDSLHYQGEFNGNGHSISGLFIQYGENYIGLFKSIGTDGIVKNLSIKDARYVLKSVSGCSIGECVYPRVGGIAAENEGLLDSVSFDGIIEASKNFETHLGGIVGFNLGTVSNAVNRAEINTVWSYIGGIAGTNGGTVIHCVNYGKMNSIGILPISPLIYIGGIIGNNYGNALVSDNVNTADIYASMESDENSGGYRNVFAYGGGVVGFQHAANPLVRCSNYGKIQIYAGRRNVLSQYATSRSASAYAGGIIGVSVMAAENISNYGPVVSVSSDGNSFAGGIAGLLNSALVKNAFSATDSVIADSLAGAFIGKLLCHYNRSCGTSNTYYDKTLLPSLPFANVVVDSGTPAIDSLSLPTGKMQCDEFTLNLNTVNNTEMVSGIWERCGEYPVLIGNCEIQRMTYSETPTILHSVRGKNEKRKTWENANERGRYKADGKYINGRNAFGFYFLKR